MQLTLTATVADPVGFDEVRLNPPFESPTNLVENCPNHPISISVSGLGTSLWRDTFFFKLFSPYLFWDGLSLQKKKKGLF